MELWLKTSVMDLLDWLDKLDWRDWLDKLEGQDLLDYLGELIEVEKQDCFDVGVLLDVPKIVG
jgi:hypothetical protein